jgi:hypothetical protein
MQLEISVAPWIGGAPVCEFASEMAVLASRSSRAARGQG